jgi:UDP-glucose 4-epimerase
MKLTKSNVFVTGGLGFIGYNLVKRLIDLNCNVTVFDNFSSNVVDNIDQTHVIKGDILHLEELKDSIKGNDIIYHLAASPSVPFSSEHPCEDFKINTQGTLNVPKASSESDAKLVIYTSSGGAVYGNRVKLPVNEEQPCFPISPYGISKLAGERYCQVFNKTFGLNTIILRIFNVYGPW